MRGGLLVALLALMPLPCAAQRVTPAFARWQIAEAQPTSLVVSGGEPLPNHGRVGFLAGAAIGAVAGGLGLAVAVRCDQGCLEVTLMGAAVGAALFGLIGYAIGREIPRAAPPSASISGVAALEGAAP
jgi:hypothetical protein